MKRCISLVLVVMSCAMTQAATYTLDVLLKSGFRNSHEIKIVEEEMRKASEQIAEVKGGAMPSVDFAMNYQYAIRQYVPYDMDMGGGGQSAYVPAGQTVGEHNGDAADQVLAAYIDQLNFFLMNAFGSIDFTMPPNTIQMGLEIKQPIFAQGKVMTGLRIAKNYQQGLLCKYEARQDSVGATIIKLFYGGLLAQQRVAVQEKAVELARETNRIAVIKFAVGKGSELDTLISRLNLEKALVDEREAHAQRTIAIEALLKTTGVVDLPDSVILEGDFPLADFSISYQEAVSRMEHKNKIISQLASGEKVQDLLVKLAKSDFLPLVYCGGSFNKISMFDRVREIELSDDYKVFVGMTVNLFSGFKRSHKLQQAYADKRSYDHTFSLARNGLSLGLKAVWERMENARTSQEQARRIVELAEKGFQIARRSFELGSLTMHEMNQREMELNGARLALNFARYSFHSAVVDLQVLMGEVPIDEYIAH